MQNRNPILVLVLCLITCGIYNIYWFVVTKGEMKKLGADIPTAWLLIIPLVNLYWLWCWCKGVEKVTNGAWGAVVNFIICLLICPVGAAISQSHFNKIAAPAPAA